MAMNTTGGTIVANGTTTGALSTMLNAHAIFQFLVRALPYLVLEKFGQAYPLPERSTKQIKFRRYEALSATPTKLTEGVTPTPSLASTMSQGRSRFSVSRIPRSACGSCPSYRDW